MNKLKKILPILTLAIYWPALFLLTHIPTLPKILAIEIPGSDKTIHFITYFMLTFIYWMASNGTTRPHFKHWSVYWTLLLIMAYGGVDEFTQQFIKGRSGELLDWYCDIGGAMSAIIVLYLFHKPLHWLVLYWVGLFIFTHILCNSLLFSVPSYWHQYEQIFGFITYLVLTLLFWRTLSTGAQFTINGKIFIATIFVMPLTAFVDEALSWLQHGYFNGLNFSASSFGIGLGVICATIFSKQYLAQLDEKNAGYNKVIDVEDLMATGKK